MGLSRRAFLTSTAALAAAVGSSAPSPTAEGRGAEAMEAALELLAGAGPEYSGGLANHGPMAAEALVALERPEAVVPWVEGYRRRLDTRPNGTRPIAADQWREALGERARVGDWIAFFRRRAEEQPWRELIAEWSPRLMPGVVAAAFHGVIRVAHAARSLEARETPARRLELVDGFAYWAANFNPLPESRGARAVGGLPSQRLAAVVLVPAERRVSYGNITARLAPVKTFAPFAGVADLAEVSGDASRFLSDLTETFAGVLIATVPPGSLITFIHAVTGPSAVRLLLPYLDAGAPAAAMKAPGGAGGTATAAALRYAWQGAAAHFSAFGGVAPRPLADGAAPTRDQLIAQAVASGDEHAIKLTEACLREHARNPSPVYLLAARHAMERL